MTLIVYTLLYLIRKIIVAMQLQFQRCSKVPLQNAHRRDRAISVFRFLRLSVPLCVKATSLGSIFLVDTDKSLFAIVT